MNSVKKKHADILYLTLAGFFIAALVACNLIANKFVTVDLGFKTFVVSAGILPYPLTFLITDMLSEIYGKKKTNRVVIVGFAVSLFVLGILWLGGQFPAIEGSPVSDELYTTVFQNAGRVIMASMTAYLIAQLVDVRLFHFWKRVTKGKMLWVRNNGSTIMSQFIDTTLVVLVLFWGVRPSSELFQFIIDGWMFKSLVALADTPLFYLFSGMARRHFGLQMGQELP